MQTMIEIIGGSAITVSLTDNVNNAHGLVARLSGLPGAERTDCENGCNKVLAYSEMTAPENREPVLWEKLDAVAGRMLS